eukprot:14277-Heterococcus_DN1.PRE.1
MRVAVSSVTHCSNISICKQRAADVHTKALNANCGAVSGHQSTAALQMASAVLVVDYELQCSRDWPSQDIRAILALVVTLSTLQIRAWTLLCVDLCAHHASFTCAYA